MPTVSELISENITNAVIQSQTWGGVLYNVKAYGAKGDGVTNDTAAIQSTIDAVIAAGAQNVYFPVGSYVASGLINTASVNFVGDGASFVGDTYYIFPYGMQAKSQRLGTGENTCNFFLSTEGNNKETDAGTGVVAMQVVTGSRTDYTHGSIEYPRVWAMNAVVAKHENFPTSYVVGIEASMTNNTTDHDDVIGFLSSYIGLQEGGKSAFESTGNTAGWNYGLYLDGIKTTGTGILLNDNISSSGGMSIGINLSLVSNYSNGAILLGFTHKIATKNSTGVIKDLIKTTTGDNIIIGGDMGGTGATNIRAAGNFVALQDKTGANKLLVDTDANNSIQIFVNGVLTRVTVGAVDSGGAGFRLLRVAN